MTTFLFDMDGTLFDTEKYYQKAWYQAISEAGHELDYSEVLKLRSLGYPFVIRQFQEWFGTADDYNAIKKRRTELMEMVFQRGIPLKPQVPETLHTLREAGNTLAVVTATPKERAERNLTENGLLPFFDRVISTSMVETGKPAPDVYLYACEILKVSPESCYAVEDSPNGVKSAYDAGCKVIMIPDLTQPDEETAQLLYRKLDTFGELINILKK